MSIEDAKSTEQMKTTSLTIPKGHLFNGVPVMLYSDFDVSIRYSNCGCEAECFST